ncbi:FecR family protein [Methylomonas sp. MS20]|uniref:FecR family protein n=1 Tax=Methylomonas sp. MS20 TaxID=3418769 RepID=UPI003D08B9B5
MTRNDPSALDLKRQAVRWLVRLRSDDLSEAETLAFAEWLSQDYRHSEAFAAAENTLNEMAVVATHSEKLAVTLPPQTVSPTHPPERRSRQAARGRYWLGSGLAMAAVWLLAVLTIMPRQSHLLADYFSDYHTGTGEQRQLELADGSHLLLNTNTAISVDFNADVRQIVLHHGQARFQVAADAAHPFQVQAGELNVRALGTVFDVYQSGGQTQVIVEEHAVLALPAGRQAADGIRIEQGQQLSYRPGHTGTLETIDLELAQAWQQRQLIVSDRPLADLVNELERYRLGRIYIADETLKQQHVTGVFPLDNPDVVLETLHKVLGIRATHLGPWVVLQR